MRIVVQNFSKLLLLLVVLNFANAVASSSAPLEHLSIEDKKTLSIYLMELVVEYEEIHNQNLTPEKYSLLKKARQLKAIFLIPNAYASENKDPGPETDIPLNVNPEYRASESARFDVLVGDNPALGGYFCIYSGGWGSFSTKKDQGKYICEPPYTERTGGHASMFYYDGSRVNDKDETDQCKIKNKENISCNPAIFGFQDVKRSRTFCVPEKSPTANAECMDYALGKKFSPGADSVKDRLKWLSEQNSSEANKKKYAELYRYLYKMCLCTDGSFVETNTDLQQKIIPTKSCFSFITMISEANGCTTFKDSTAPSNDLDIVKKIRDLSAEYLSNKSKDVEKQYAELIKESGKKLKKDLNLICENGKGGENEKPKEPSLQIKDSKDSEEVTLKAIVTGEGNWEFEWWKETSSQSKKIAGLAGDSDDSPKKEEGEDSTSIKKESLNSKENTVKVKYEEKSFKVCVEAKLDKEDFKDRKCYTVQSKAEREKEVEDSTPVITPIGGPQLPKIPAPSLRKGVDFSRSGIL